MANYRGLNIDVFTAHLQMEVQGRTNKPQGLYREATVRDKRFLDWAGRSTCPA